MVDPQQEALEALRWLRERGFDLRLAAKHRGTFFVDLIPTADPDSVIPNYGSGMTIERAVVAARERYAAEQV